MFEETPIQSEYSVFVKNQTTRPLLKLARNVSLSSEVAMRDDALIEMEPCAGCNGSRPCPCYCGRKYHRQWFNGRGKPVRKDKCHMCLSSPFSVAGSPYCGCGRADTFGLKEEDARAPLHSSPTTPYERPAHRPSAAVRYYSDQAGIRDLLVADFHYDAQRINYRSGNCVHDPFWCHCRDCRPIY